MMIRLTSLLAAFALLHLLEGTPVYSQSPNQDFVEIWLSGGISLDIPGSFRMLDQEGRSLQFAYGASVLDLTDIPRGPGGVLLAARSSPTREGWAEVIVSVQYGKVGSQAEVAALTMEQINVVDRQMKADIEASSAVTGSQVLEWRGSRRVRVGSAWSLVTNYTYQMPGDATPREMISHRIFMGDRSIGVLLQQSGENAGTWRIILKRVNDSLEVAVPEGADNL